MTLRHSFPMRQQGVAIITALLLAALAITIVTSLFWQQQVQVRSIENQRLQLQKQWILRGALDWAQLILRENGKAGVDGLDDPWAVPLQETRLDQYVEGDADAGDASISGNIVDAQSRFNLFNLTVLSSNNFSAEQKAARQKIVVQRSVVFGRLLTSLKLDPGLADKVTTMIGSTQLQASGETRTVQPMPVVHVDDLLAVPGFTPAIISKLRDYVVVTPNPDAKVNINTASAELIAATLGTLSVQDVKTQIVAVRTRLGKFRDQSAFQLNVPNVTLGDDFEFKTDYFLVNGNVHLSHASMNMQTLIRRPANAPTKIMWIRQQ